MKLSDVLDILTKSKSILGDVANDAEVVLKSLEDGQGSVIQRIEVAFVAGAEAVTNQLTLVHGPASPVVSDPTASTTTEPVSGDTSATAS